jgi:type IV secretion system protein VirB8
MAKRSQKAIEKQEHEEYLKEAQGWERDRIYQEQKSTRLAWRITGVSCFITILAVGGLSVLGPLKTVVPVVIETDKTTGVVSVVKEMSDSKDSYGEVLDKYFLKKYLRYREGYSSALSQYNYKAVGLMSGNAESQRYFAWFNPKNQNSPLNLYKDFATAKVTIRSVSFLPKNDARKKDANPDTTVAIVRYMKEVERNGDRNVSNWTATITYKYLKLALSEADREINPLGLQVLEYRNDPEGEAFEIPAPQKAAANAAPAPAVSAFPPSPQAANAAGGK